MADIFFGKFREIVEPKDVSRDTSEKPVIEKSNKEIFVKLSSNLWGL